MIDENLYTSHFIFIKLVGTFTLVYIVLLCKKDYYSLALGTSEQSAQLHINQELHREFKKIWTHSLP